MRRFRTVFTDFIGLCRVCGIRVGIRWLLAVLRRLHECYSVGHLQPADNALGEGPFSLRFGKARAKLVAECVLTGVRETWVRDGYLGAGFLKIPPNATVVDLGSNMGGFSTLALGHDPGVRVIAVEADPEQLPRLQRNLELNRWTGRVNVINAFIGAQTCIQQQMAREVRFHGVPTLSEEALLERVGSRIDFLKCDIEGSEFALFRQGSKLIEAADQIAMELHPHAGDVDSIIQQLKAAGFETRAHTEPPTTTVLARRAR
jgi:FkbM family methyltransferase